MYLSSETILRGRRSFLLGSAGTFGSLALATMLARDGLMADDLSRTAPGSAGTDSRPLLPRQPHFAPRATNCILIYLEGAPSQIDLFDEKPKLKELHGQPLPTSMTDQVRFAFIQKESAVLMGSPRRFAPHGQCGMELSDLLPGIGSCADEIALVRSMVTPAFNHHPGQLMMHTGSTNFGRPSMGSWLTYGLGSESDNLPGYVVLSAGRGTSGGASNWSSGFLPSTYEGVLFRNQGEPVLNLNNPSTLSSHIQRTSLDSLAALNARHFDATLDPEVSSRIAAYELAFRMQSAAPELIDLAGETRSTLDAYGVDRPHPEFQAFARNCVLARRMVERGVRCVSLYHASWDHHSDLDAGLTHNCGMADQPIAALLNDLKQRGLLDTTLVIWASEFGRTPLGENRAGQKPNTGRDHHPFAFSLWLAGGGIRGGQVYGKTDEIGWNVVENPVSIHDLHATALHLFGFDHLRLTYRFAGRDFRLTDVAGQVIEPLLA